MKNDDRSRNQSYDRIFFQFCPLTPSEIKTLHVCRVILLLKEIGVSLFGISEDMAENLAFFPLPVMTVL